MAIQAHGASFGDHCSIIFWILQILVGLCWKMCKVGHRAFESTKHAQMSTKWAPCQQMADGCQQIKQIECPPNAIS